MRHATLIAFATMTAACATASSSADSAALRAGGAVLDDTLRVPLGAAAVTRDTAVRVTFREKLADSRCALGVVCVWAGDVGAAVRVETVAGAVDGQVHTAIEPRALNAGAYRVTLLDMTPVPGDTVSPRRHVATLRVVRGDH
jgi:hypothetical protein